MRWRLDDGQIEVVDERVAEILRHKTPAERAAMVFDCNEFVRMAVVGGIRAQHPQWNDRQVQEELVRRVLGDAGRDLQARA